LLKTFPFHGFTFLLHRPSIDSIVYRQNHAKILTKTVQEGKKNMIIFITLFFELGYAPQKI